MTYKHSIMMNEELMKYKKLSILGKSIDIEGEQRWKSEGIASRIRN